MTGNWGRWGPEDEVGAKNLVGPDKIVAALGLVKEGRVYDLSRPVQPSGVPMVKSRPAPVHTFTVDGGDYAVGGKLSNDCGSVEDNLFLHLHGHTAHIDSLGHVWTGEQLYNGYSYLTIRSTGMRRLGIEKLGSLVTRGVFLDVPGRLGLDNLGPSEEVTPDHLSACLEAIDAELEPGDAVLVRTGWDRLYDADPDLWEASAPGIGMAAGRWLVERDVALVAVDTAAAEVFPYPPGTTAPVHQLLLRDHGVYLVELIRLDELARDARGVFAFVAAPVRIRGASGSPLNPLAIV